VIVNDKDRMKAVDLARALVSRDNKEFIVPSNEEIRLMARLIAADYSEMDDPLIEKTSALVESGLTHLQFLHAVLVRDRSVILDKESQYRGSWKRRGGVGAFMMLARKWDRIEPALEPHYDIFKALSGDGREEGMVDDIRDLRRYLTLVETESILRGWTP
jgi:hypothetical protein